jgi:phosphoribosyl-ATP pyrophosphohydrolase
MDGQAIQLRRGRDKILECGDPEELLRGFSRYGKTAVIDLDAALGKGDNEELIRHLCSLSTCYVGGGIRSIEKARRLLKAGAYKIIVGTKATPKFFQNFPVSKVLASVDEEEGVVVNHGWRKKTSELPIERAMKLAPYVSGFVYTLVDREGTLAGSDFERFNKFIESVPRPVIVAGGIATLEDVVSLEKKGADCILGTAIYMNRIDLSEAFVQCMNFSKEDRLIAAVIRDSVGHLRMIGYMNKAALSKTLNSGFITFWNRSKQKLRVQGEKNGNLLKVETIRPDCNRSAVLILTEPVGPTCHLGGLSCFGDDAFDLFDLEAELCKRIQLQPEGSYTAYLGRNPQKIRGKIIEEAIELIEARNENEIIHESADIFFHLIAFLAIKKISLSKIINELDGRRSWDIMSSP